MNQHDREAHKNRSIQPPSDIFRFPTRAEILNARAKEQEQQQAQNKPVESSYQDEDLSGCLSGFLKPREIAQPKPVETSNYQDEDLSGCLSGFLKPREIAQPKPVETSNYQDEDLSGCLSGFLKPREIKPQPSQRDRFAPTRRDNTTGEITPIDRDDLSGAIAPLDEEKSGWLYFN
jgi:hypothetical protein